MVVMILERVPESVRGELSLWMIEPKAGVFVGNLSALVRDKLWDKVREKSKRGSCTMIHTHNNEQGYLIRYPCSKLYNDSYPQQRTRVPDQPTRRK